MTDHPATQPACQAYDALACFSRASLPQFWQALRDQTREMMLHEQEARAADARGDRKFAAELREIARVYRETSNAAFRDYLEARWWVAPRLDPFLFAALPFDGMDLAAIEPERAAAACRAAWAAVAALPPEAEPAAKAEWCGTAAARRGPGRPKADYETVQREAQIAADWARAREAGIYKGDFARQHGLSTTDFDALLDRVRKRNCPSE